MILGSKRLVTPGLQDPVVQKLDLFFSQTHMSRHTSTLHNPKQLIVLEWCSMPYYIYIIFTAVDHIEGVYTTWYKCSIFWPILKGFLYILFKINLESTPLHPPLLSPPIFLHSPRPVKPDGRPHLFRFHRSQLLWKLLCALWIPNLTV